MPLLNPDEVFAAFWATACEDAQYYENDSACQEGREPESFEGEPAADYGDKYRAACAAVCAAAESLLAALDLNRFPRSKGESSLSDAFGSDLYLTAAGHGAGFWDGDWGPAGDALTATATRMPSGDLMHHINGGLFFC